MKYFFTKENRDCPPEAPYIAARLRLLLPWEIQPLLVTRIIGTWLVAPAAEIARGKRSKNNNTSMRNQARVINLEHVRVQDHLVG